MLAAIMELRRAAENERIFLDICKNSCVFNEGDALLKIKKSAGGDDVHVGEASAQNCNIHSARMIMQQKKEHHPRIRGREVDKLHGVLRA